MLKSILLLLPLLSGPAFAIGCPTLVDFAALSVVEQTAFVHRLDVRGEEPDELAAVGNLLLYGNATAHPRVRSASVELLLRIGVARPGLTSFWLSQSMTVRRAALRDAGVVLAKGEVPPDDHWVIAANFLAAVTQAELTEVTLESVDEWRSSRRVHGPVYHFLAYQLGQVVGMLGEEYRARATQVVASLEHAARGVRPRL